MSFAPPSFLFFLLILSASINVGIAVPRKPTGGLDFAGESPFTAKASFIRYWKKQVSSDLPKQWFLNKTSPLDGVQFATFSNLADHNLLPTKLDAFCTDAHLLCYPEMTSLSRKTDKDVDFTSYNFTNQNFTNYGTRKVAGVDSFKNYSDGENVPFNSFTSYSRHSVNHDDKFNFYAPDTNVDDQEFKSYGKSATGGSGSFAGYNDNINIAGIAFTSYSDTGSRRKQDFTTYADNSNTGNDTFKSYGKKGQNDVNDFVSYGNNSNVVTSSFSNYGEEGHSANDTFTTYASNGNVPLNQFNNYEPGGNSADATFKNYRDNSNVGDDAFQSYGKGSSDPNISFANYGQSINQGTTKFTGYGKDAQNQTAVVGFTTYGLNTTFKEYAKNGVKFSDYVNGTSVSSVAATNASLVPEEKNTVVNKANRWVEPGKFFREDMLTTGKMMPMPDIYDKMPKRSFLPKRILTKLPFSSGKIEDMQRIFRVRDDSTMKGMIVNALNECERAPSSGETKRCVGSAEDMVDFATAVLGKNVVVRTTENTRGSKGDILIGSVKGINGGKVTKSVSCHQSLFPYLLYYCHSVPKVRVYEVDILDPKSKEKINQGTSICHIDTSSWSRNHGAFLALGPGPGKIEVCHWIFENDMTWTIAD